MTAKYIPEVGDKVAASRKIKSNIYNNIVIGSVTDVWVDSCRIITNEGTAIEGKFNLHFSDWVFQNLELDLALSDTGEEASGTETTV